MNQQRELDEVVWTENLSDPRLSQGDRVLEASQTLIGTALRVPDPRGAAAPRRQEGSASLVITGGALWIGGRHERC